MKTLQAGLLVLAFAAACHTPPPARAAIVASCDEASLRAAIATGEPVTFGCDGTIILSSPLVVTDSTVLDASGRRVVLSGSNSVRLLEVLEGASLFLNHLVLANGKSTNGGAVRNLGTFEATDCAFTSNSAIGFFFQQTALQPPVTLLGEGGAIWNGASAVLRRCVFDRNRATGFNSYWQFDRGGYGGAVWNGGQLFVSDCVFGTNSAVGGTGVSPGPDGLTLRTEAMGKEGRSTIPSRLSC